MKYRVVAAAALAAALIAGIGGAAGAQEITPESLGSTGLILSGPASARRPVGTAFFVEVPSHRFKGNSFIYLVTARHAMLDGAGQPLHELWFSIGHNKGGKPTVRRLPPTNQWFLDPRDHYADLAALPYSPPGADFTTVQLSRIADSSGSRYLGADAYYVSLLSEPPTTTPIMTVHFGRVSIADGVAGTVPGAGPQSLYFMEGLTAPRLSGSPVFIRAGGQVLLWGLVEVGSAIEGGSARTGMVGVLPASKIAETVRAMAAAQDQSPPHSAP